MRLSDLKAGSNTKQTLLLPVASHYPIEMTVICGSCPGKTLVVTAGVHGCEYVGIETLNRLKKELDPIDLSGVSSCFPGKSRRLLHGVQTDNPCRWSKFKPYVSRRS